MQVGEKKVDLSTALIVRHVYKYLVSKKNKKKTWNDSSVRYHQNSHSAGVCCFRLHALVLLVNAALLN